MKKSVSEKVEVSGQKPKRNILYIEILRIFACFFVIFNHTSTNGFLLFAKRDMGSLRYWIDLFISIFCKFSVPVFFAISGALLLPKEDESLKDIYLKRVLRMFMVLLGFSALYYFWDVVHGKAELGFGVFFSKFYQSSWNGTYWYLYAYIPFLMTLPLLRALAINLKDRHYIYILSLNVVFHWLVPVFQYFVLKNEYKINDYFNNNLKWTFINVVEYPLLGYYLEHRVKDLEKKGKQLWLLWAANLICIALCCVMTYLKQKAGDGVDQAFHNTFVMLNAASVYLTVKYIVLKVEGKLPHVLIAAVASLGSCSFGVYLWHALILNKWSGINRIWAFFRDTCSINYMISAFLVCLFVFLVGYVLTLLLRLLKKAI